MFLYLDALWHCTHPFFLFPLTEKLLYRFILSFQYRYTRQNSLGVVPRPEYIGQLLFHLHLGETNNLNIVLLSRVDFQNHKTQYICNIVCLGDNNLICFGGLFSTTTFVKHLFLGTEARDSNSASETLSTFSSVLRSLHLFRRDHDETFFSMSFSIAV